MGAPHWRQLTASEREAFQAAVAFLNGRMERADTLRWALDLTKHDVALRAAVLHSCDTSLPDPWATAWRLIEEAWRAAPASTSDQHMEVVEVDSRIARGDRSGVVIETIVEIVRPRLGVNLARGAFERSRAWKPRTASELVQSRLVSGELVDLDRLGLSRVEDLAFLAELARRLEDAIETGLATARRFGWDGKKPWQVGMPERVGMVPRGEGGLRDDVDEFHEGLAPVVKLWRAVLGRIVELDIQVAQPIIDRLRSNGSLPHQRVWFDLATDARLAPADAVEAAVLAVDQKQFWDGDTFPELALLRAKRFGDLSRDGQSIIAKRLRRGPPKSVWRHDLPAARIRELTVQIAARELQRIELFGHSLPTAEAEWLAKHLPGMLAANPEPSVDNGLPGAPDNFEVPPPEDDGYDDLVGRERLDRLERALRQTRTSWHDSPAERAARWIRQPGRASALVPDFESVGAADRDYPHVWENFSWSYGRATGDASTPVEASRVLALVADIPDRIVETGADALSDLLSNPLRALATTPAFTSVWLRIWPHAVARTNSEQPADEAPSLNVVIRGGDEEKDLDSYNTAVGRMVSAFLAMCPTLADDVVAFPADAPQTLLRELLLAQGGRAGLVVRHRLLEHLSYFLRADPTWATENLLPALDGNSEATRALWNAVARRPITDDLLTVLAPQLPRRVLDPVLPRKTRQRLAFRLLADTLHALLNGRPPRVSRAELQGMLREVDDEVRAHVADAPQRFLNEVARPSGPSREDLFDRAVKPFLADIWPQERTLATPTVSKAFAEIPAAAGERFVEAAAAIERFIRPFDCWSMIDFGLWGEDEPGRAKLARIDTPAKAAAFLRLLAGSIGQGAGAVTPLDLSAALQQIRRVAPKLAEEANYRRLATVARL